MEKYQDSNYIFKVNCIRLGLTLNGIYPWMFFIFSAWGCTHNRSINEKYFVPGGQKQLLGKSVRSYWTADQWLSRTVKKTVRENESNTPKNVHQQHQLCASTPRFWVILIVFAIASVLSLVSERGWNSRSSVSHHTCFRRFIRWRFLQECVWFAGRHRGGRREVRPPPIQYKTSQSSPGLPLSVTWQGATALAVKTQRYR